MSLLDLTASYVDHVLSSLGGSGIKALLLDAPSLSAVSLSCPQSALMAKGVYLFERLEDTMAFQASGQANER